MILKDLVIADTSLFSEISGFVIIKRGSKYYEIAVRMRYDRAPKTGRTKWLAEYKDLTKRFMKECHNVDKYYIVSTVKPVDRFGINIHEEEITF